MANFTIAIAGNPNCGKTALFNALTGSRQNVGNWPGVTVEKKEGYFDLGGRHIKVVDLPGTYAIFANAEDERAAVDYLLTREASLIINIVDATNIERNLFLTSQIADMKIPMVIAVNMMDMAEKRGIHLDLDALSKEYGVPCISLSAVNDKSVMNFISEMGHIIAQPLKSPKAMVYNPQIESAVNYLENSVEPVAKMLKADSRWVSLMYLGCEKSYEDKFLEAGIKINRGELQKIIGEEPEFAMAECRYLKSHEVATNVIVARPSKKSFSDKLDGVLLNRFASLPIFLLVMYLVFWLAVSVGSAFIDFFDILFGAIFVDGLGYLLSDVLGFPDFVTAILAGGVGAGIQTVSTFVPVIFFMFLCLSFLEDSGYMARGAFVADRFMRFLGLPGRAFVPMMVGFGCGVPGIMGSRVLESKRERFLTIFLVPFMSCGARLPVYALFAAAFFGKQAGTVVFLLYLSGIIFAIVYGLILRRSLFVGNANNFVMELPPYHLPKFKHLFLHSWQRLKDYVIRAGKVITIAVAVLGFLNSFGYVDGKFTAGNADSENSLLSYVGKAINPVFAPFGVEEHNWPASVSLFTGVLAKEAVVGTLNSLYSMAESKPAENAPNFLGDCTEEDSEESAVNIGESFKEAVASIPQNLAGTIGALVDPLGTAGELQTSEEATLKLATLQKLQNSKALNCEEFLAFKNFDEDSENIRHLAFAKLAAAGVELNSTEIEALEIGDISESADVYSNLRSYFHNGGHQGFNWQVFAFLIFVLLYVPCLAVMGVVVREIGLKLGILMATVQTIIAWAIATLVYQIPVGGSSLWITIAIIAIALTVAFLKIFGIKANRQKKFED